MIAEPNIGTALLVAEGREASHLSIESLLLACGASALFFAVLFVASWWAMQKFWAPFQSLALGVQADSVARIGSTVHAIILVPGLIWYLLNTSFDTMWEPVPGFESTRNTRVASYFFAFACGYFLTDGITTYWYRMPMYQVFLLHHVLAATPYVIYLFLTPCHRGCYLLASFLIVEATNVSMNNSVLLERSGRGGSMSYALNLYASFFLWIVCRLYVPCRCVYLIHTAVWPDCSSTHKRCLGFSVVCAWFIVVFCAYAFVMVLCKEMLQRWKQEPQPGVVCKQLEVVPDPSLSAAERSILTPTHVSLYNARKALHEVEGAVDKMCLELRGRIDGDAADSTSNITTSSSSNKPPRKVGTGDTPVRVSGIGRQESPLFLASPSPSSALPTDSPRNADSPMRMKLSSSGLSDFECSNGSGELRSLKGKKGKK